MEDMHSGNQFFPPRTLSGCSGIADSLLLIPRRQHLLAHLLPWTVLGVRLFVKLEALSFSFRSFRPPSTQLCLVERFLVKQSSSSFSLYQFKRKGALVKKNQHVLIGAVYFKPRINMKYFLCTHKQKSPRGIAWVVKINSETDLAPRKYPSRWSPAFATAFSLVRACHP